MANIRELRCVVGGCLYAPDEVEYTCPLHGEVATLDILYDYEALRATLDRDRISCSKVTNHWRYLPLLPLDDDAQLPPLAVGGTPLYDAQRLAESLGLRRVWVKDDGANPTGSLKDRASALVLAKAMTRGIRVVATASTGNAAAALAGIGAALPDIDILIFVPASAPEAKIAQLLVYGAHVLLVDGSYDDAFELCMQVCEERGWYSRNTGVNPYTTEGKKTVSLEIAEGLGWRAPDVVAVSVGDGSIISGVYKGFWDLLQLGWIARMPRIIGVQAEGSAALAHAWRDGIAAEDMIRAEAHTIADSISSELPRDRAKALRAARETGGGFVTVPDCAILAAIPQMAQLSGVFAEPAAAATLAGARAALREGLLSADEELVIVSAGNGLKDIAAARRSVGGGQPVAANFASVRDGLAKAGLL